MDNKLIENLKRSGMGQIISAGSLVVLFLIICVIIAGAMMGGVGGYFDSSLDVNGPLILAGATSGVLLVLIFMVVAYVIMSIFKILGVIDLFKAATPLNDGTGVNFTSVLPWIILVMHLVSIILSFYIQVIFGFIGGISCFCIRKKLLNLQDNTLI